jgi:hypothetical protein
MIYTLLMSLISIFLDLLAILGVAKMDKDYGDHYPSPKGPYLTTQIEGVSEDC